MRPALALLAVLVVARPARAELWSSTLGELLEHASRIEVVAVTHVGDRGLDALVLETFRSPHRAGDVVHFDVGWMPMPKAGERVLVVCDPYECPRALGVERAGSYRLIAEQPGDGAFVVPNLVGHDAIPLLAAGKPAPDLCIRGLVELLDDAARPPFELHVRASDGRGKGRLDGRDVAASLGVVWFAGEAGTLSIDLVGDHGSVTLVAADAARDKAGCYSTSVLPVQPLARSRSSLDAALAGKPSRATIGRARLDIPKGMPLAGTHELALEVTSDGYLELASDVAEGRVSRISNYADHFGVGFPTKGGAPNDPELDLDFAVPSVDGYEHGAAVAKALRQGAKVTASWTQHGKTTPLGTVVFTYVPEKQR